MAANFAAVTSYIFGSGLMLKVGQGQPRFIYQLPCLNLAAPIGATIAGRYLAGRFIVGPDIERAIGGFTGNPVDMTTGRKLLANETDSVLPGMMPIEWSRFYASDLAIDSVLGQGWVLPGSKAADQRLTDISAPGGVRVHLHYEHPLGRLTVTDP